MNSIGRFVLVWLGQLVSLVCSALTGFVLGIWVYQLSGSATQFALITLCEALAAIVVAPLAGVIADRVDRRRILIACDTVAAVATGALALLLAAGQLDLWHIYVITASTAMCGMVRMVAFTTMVPLLVPKQHLSRANGLVQAATAAQIAAPLAAGALLGTVGLTGVVVIDLASFGFALLITLVLPLPAQARFPAAAEPGDQVGFLGEISAGWTELRRRRGLLGLLGLLAAFDFCFGLAGVLVQPLILTFASPVTLGLLMFLGGSGLFVGSALMTAWGGPRRRIPGIAAFLALGGVALALHALAPSPLLLAFVGPAFLFTLPVVTSCTMTVLQTKADPAVLGRVNATIRIASQAASALAFAVAGPLADRVFEPMMREGGALAGSIGGLIGVGPGRGIALIFIVSGVLIVVLALVAALQPTLRAVENLPDLLQPADSTTSSPDPVPEPKPVAEPRPA